MSEQWPVNSEQKKLSNQIPPAPLWERGDLDFLAPFGAALGNPEMTGRQTVRARTKNAFLLGQKSESKTATVS